MVGVEVSIILFFWIVIDTVETEFSNFQFEYLIKFKNISWTASVRESGTGT
jgi:hypothetical protein